MSSLIIRAIEMKQYK